MITEIKQEIQNKDLKAIHLPSTICFKLAEIRAKYNIARGDYHSFNSDIFLLGIEEYEKRKGENTPLSENSAFKNRVNELNRNKEGKQG